MPLTKEQQQFVKMMKDPEVKKMLTGDSSDELEALLDDIDIDDNDTIESISKKSSAKIKQLVKYFTKEMANVKESAVEEATKDTREKEAVAIQEFSANNPGMNNPKVVAMMQPLYDKGATLEESYAIACKGLDLDPVTGEVPKAEDEDKGSEDKAKEDEESTEKKEEEGAKQSAKSDLGQDDDDAGGDAEAEDSDKPLSLDDALASASADYLAKNGNIFEKE